ncbi:hypothetical protein SAMN06265222_10712 [Neorhodopirellula lusitana]|uniref:Uncharacterized protein n=1 Tax=Neorhodopirellula lusitana TaxID=445327 RepID=A0ABY1QA66_9BACT|nr:hypothetical protein [Neorhodopirellula lusitana]SMP60882.1 hypothetical protein SAMN06265222_10712 [Neorhodopirellula lusitana]
MNRYLIFIVLLVALLNSVHAGNDGDADTTVQPPPEQFLVELSEYEIDNALPVGLIEAEVLDLIRTSGGIPVETVRITAISDTQSFCKFGRRATATVGTITHGNTTSHRTKEVELGLVLRITLSARTDGAVADIDYSTSRMAQAGTADSPPDVLTNSMQATQHYSFGERRLLSTRGGDKTTCVVVTVSKID